MIVSKFRDFANRANSVIETQQTIINAKRSIGSFENRCLLII